MGGQGSGANSVNSRAKSITNGALIHKAQSSDLTLVPIDNVIEKPPQSPEGVRNSKKYASPIILVIFSCRIILLTKLSGQDHLFQSISYIISKTLVVIHLFYFLIIYIFFN